MSKPINLFNDWLISTNELILTGPEDIIAEVVNQTYLFGDLMKGKGVAQVVKGGNSITDRIQLRDTTQFSFYQPNANFTPAIEDTLDRIVAPWRFAHNMWAYTDQEIELNAGGDGASQKIQFKDIRTSKQQATKVNTLTNLETALWATHSDATMEQAGGTDPYSIRSFITEDGLAGSGSTLTMGVSPSTRSRWRNQVSNYAAATISTSLQGGFDDMWRKVDFQSPGAMYKGEIRQTNYDKFRILTNLDGIKNYVAITRDANDRLQVQNDIGTYNGRGNTGGVTFNGLGVDYIKQMDSIGYSTGQPRYFWINTDYMFPVFHTSRYFSELEPMRSPNQPYTWVVHTDVWYNLIIRSRQRHGILVPN